jgi:hypothetical protein
MKTIKFYFYSFAMVFLLHSCTESEHSNDNLESKLTIENVKKIANSNGFTFIDKPTENNVVKVKSIEELSNILKIINNRFKTEIIVGLPNQNSEFTNEKISTLIDEQYQKFYEFNNKLKSTNNQGGGKNSKSTNDDPPTYQYTQTFYFDNDWPCSNVAVHINYSINSQGQVISADVTSTTYGYSFGNTYQQNYSSVSYSGSTIVFQMGAGFTTSVGIGSFSMTNTNNSQYTGFIQFRGSLGGGGGGSAMEVVYGACKQGPEELMEQ